MQVLSRLLRPLSGQPAGPMADFLLAALLEDIPQAALPLLRERAMFVVRLCMVWVSCLLLMH